MEVKSLIKIRCNENRKAEREYIYSYVFEQRFGVSFLIEYVDSHKKQLELVLPDGKIITIEDVFFNMAETHWLKPESLPSTPLSSFDIQRTIFEKVINNECFIDVFGKNNKAIINENIVTVDFFGTMFFLITGYEEYVIKEKNQFGNFPYEASLAKKAGFIDRPLVDEYIEILWKIITGFCKIQRGNGSEFLLMPTHDIDRPFLFYGLTWFQHFKGSVGDIFKRGSLKQFLARNISYYCKGKSDPYSTYEWLMKKSEGYGLKSVFYFKNSMRKSDADVPYPINTSALNKVFKLIDDKGHIIGFHPSYETYRNEVMLHEEIEGFRKHMKHIGVKQEIQYVRQHYLRYSNTDTSILHEKLGFLYDSTLGHWNMPGFRRGTCHEFFVFDLQYSRKLNVLELPLLIMESSLKCISENEEVQLDYAKKILNNCKFYNGKFVLLWHNELLAKEKDRNFYETLLLIASR